MTRNIRRYAWVVSVLILPCFTRGQVPGTGRIDIKPVRSYSGGQTLGKPAAIVVYSFAASQNDVQLNQGVANRVRMRVSGPQDDEKTKLARKIVDGFSQSLIKDLQKTGLPVSQGVTGEPAPENSLAVQGTFLTIDEGNRARRMAIGLGAGASAVEARVECSIKQAAESVLVTEFTATSQSSRKPGAAETMGAGAAPEVAAAASGATEMKQGAEGDANRMAKAIAKEITKTLKTQGWINETR